MPNERPREEDISSVTQKQYEQKRKNVHAQTPSEEEVIRATLKEKGPMPDKENVEVEPTGLSSDGRM